jgi:small nuclear ribonucleoprotein (snRNP)-like protein
MVEVVLKDGRKLEGVLVEAANDNIVIEQTTTKRIEGKKAKQKVIERIPLTSDAIKETRIVIVF